MVVRYIQESLTQVLRSKQFEATIYQFIEHSAPELNFYCLLRMHQPRYLGTNPLRTTTNFRLITLTETEAQDGLEARYKFRL